MKLLVVISVVMWILKIELWRFGVLVEYFISSGSTLPTSWIFVFDISIILIFSYFSILSVVISVHVCEEF